MSSDQRRWDHARRQRNYAARTFVAGRWIAPVPEDRHGRCCTYTNHGCRCVACTVANRECVRSRREIGPK